LLPLIGVVIGVGIDQVSILHLDEENPDLPEAIRAIFRTSAELLRDYFPAFKTIRRNEKNDILQYSVVEGFWLQHTYLDSSVIPRGIILTSQKNRGNEILLGGN
jgi:hypothetical protein